MISGLRSQSNIDPDAQFAAFRIAVQGVSDEAIQHTASMFIRGEVKDHEADWLPATGRFARECRDTERGIDLVRNRPKQIPHRGVSHGFKDMRIVQRQITDKLASEGWFMASDNATIEKFRTGNFKVRSRHYWAIQEVWSPA